MKNSSNVLLFLFVLLLFSCKSIQSHFEQGNYKEVIHQTLKKVDTNRATTKEIKLLEDAYSKFEEQTFVEINRLKKSSSRPNWEHIYIQLDNLESVQQQIIKREPIKSKNNVTAEFNFRDVQAMKIEMGVKAAEQLQKEANFLYNAAMNDPTDFQSARDAYELYLLVEEYNPELDLHSRINEMKEIGTLSIGTKIEENYYGGRIGRFPTNHTRYSSSIIRALERTLDFSGSKWIEKKSQFSPDDLDYTIRLSINDIFLDDLQEREVNDNYTKQIEKITYTKDSLGNMIEHKSYETVRGSVRKIVREKRANVYLDLSIVNYRGLTDFSRDYYGNASVISNNCTISGDKRAIPNDINCNKSSTLMIDDKDVILEAIDEIKYDIQRDVRDFIRAVE